MSAIPASPRVGALWQRRIETLREYEVVHDGNIFGTNFSNNFVLSSEYEQARDILDTLLAHYQDVPFERVFSGREISNCGGTCFSLESRQSLAYPALDSTGSGKNCSGISPLSAASGR